MDEVRWIFASILFVGTTIATAGVYYFNLHPNLAMVILVAFGLFGAYLDIRYGKDN